MLILYFLIEIVQNEKFNLANLSAIKIVQHVALHKLDSHVFYDKS